MFTAHILFVLNPPITAQTAAETVTRAHAAALRSIGIRFALPAVLQGAVENLPEDADVIYFNSPEGLSAIVPLLTDETHFLSVSGPHDFEEHWDKHMLALWRKHDQQTLFTASITACTPPAQDAPAGKKLASLLKALPEVLKKRTQCREGVISTPNPARHTEQSPSVPEAHLPALKEVLGDDTVTLGKGLSLVCATQPVRTMVVDPAFVFGTTEFLRQAHSLAPEALSLEAYLNGYTVRALHRVHLWPVGTQPVQHMLLPSADALPGTTLARFEQLLGFQNGERLCSAKAAMGLFSPEDAYLQRIPLKLRFRQRARAAKLHLLEFDMPLMVSAFIDLPNPRVASAFYLLRFGFLRRIQSLPLVLYTGGTQERALRAAFPNTKSYPDTKLLPRTLLQKGMKEDTLFARSKMALVNHAVAMHTEFTHAAWVDMDTLPHPVCAEAVPDFSPMMDDRIHIATVNGVPDPSFIIVPRDTLPALSKLVQSITLLDAELKRGFSDALLWERLYQRKPAWFAIHPMPRRRMLFLSAFDRELLSPSLRTQLSQLPPVYYGKQDESPLKKQAAKENFPDA